MAIMAGREDDIAIAACEDAQNIMKNVEAKAKVFIDFHNQLSTAWATDASCIIGHILFSPPIAISTGTEQYTQDVAVINIDTSKIDPRVGSFPGNVIDLGHKFPLVLVGHYFVWHIRVLR